MSRHDDNDIASVCIMIRRQSIIGFLLESIPHTFCWRLKFMSVLYSLLVYYLVVPCKKLDKLDHTLGGGLLVFFP